MADPLIGLESLVDAQFTAHPSPCSLPSRDPTRSYWLLDNPLEHEGESTLLPASSDLVIIGSGITGISALWHAVHHGPRGLGITVLEARGFCSGATGRNGGHLTNYSLLAFATLERDFDRETATAGVELESHCVTELLDLIKQNGWNVDLVEGGNVQLFSTPEMAELIRQHLDAAHSAGLDISSVEWLNPAQLEESYGIVGMHTAIRLPGNNLFPHKLVTAMYRHALTVANERGINVTLHTHTPVTSVAGSTTADASTIKTARGDIEARAVLYATNAYTTALLPELCKSPRTIIPCRAQVIAARPSASAPPLGVGCSAEEGFDYFFERPRTKDSDRPGLMIMGGGRHRAPPPHELDVSDDSQLNPVISRYLRDFLPRVLPSRFPKRWPAWLRGPVRVEHEWTGIMGMTRDRDPLVGPLRLEQKGKSYICAGFSGHGMSRAYKCAQAVVADALADLAGSPRPPRPSWLPKHYAPQ